MNEKLNIQDLIDLLAEKHGMSKKNADSFVKEFFQLIEEALEKDKYVKVKGLGAFKLIDVESRESVNVNTGERFEIQGHTKVSFTPEPALKDLINKPFSHIEMWCSMTIQSWKTPLWIIVIMRMKKTPGKRQRK